MFRAIRSHISSLIPVLSDEVVDTMALGLSHSLSRHKLKFSPDKVDVMIIQAIALLDVMDKELNTYAMRTKEWYGWHFPEMAKIINDNVAYAKVILKMGFRQNASTTDMADVLPEEIETAIKAAAEVSMGTDMTDQDLMIVNGLADQVVGFHEYREELSSYLATRMQAIAPNLTTMVGDLVGARLIAHAGSLVNLAKAPASTIQILGAEKALFRALKTKHDTPKYGLIYHASLVGQATGKNKGKIARILATKTALGLRIDALSKWGVQGEGDQSEPTEEEKISVSVANRLKVERRLRTLEGKPLLGRTGANATPAGPAQPGKWELKEAKKYNPDADGLSKNAPAAADAAAAGEQEDVTMASSSSKLIEEVDSDEEMENGADGSSSEDDSDDDSDDKENSTVTAPKTTTNGKMTKAEKKAAEADTKRVEKLERRAKRAKEREEKAARKAAALEKEAEKAAAAIAKSNEAILKKANGEEKPSSSKKRKHSDEADVADKPETVEKKKRKHGEDKAEKKKKRKSSSE